MDEFQHEATTAQCTLGGRVQIAVICPVYNERENIDCFLERMQQVFARVDAGQYECRLIFSNNCSTDGTLERLEELHAAHDWVDYVTLSRNHGYQLSLVACLSQVEADLYMVCDVDCEDPPELLLEFLEQIELGSDYIYGIRNDRPDPWLLGHMRSLFYLILTQIGDSRIVPYMSEYALFRRRIRDFLIAGHNTFPFLRAEVGSAGFEIRGVTYRRESRQHGKSHYNFWGNCRFAVAGILSSTTFPLRAVFYALPFAVVANVLLALGYACSRLESADALVGMSLINGCYIISALGFVSVYLARTYQNTIGRPRFVIDFERSTPRNAGVAVRAEGKSQELSRSRFETV